MSTMQYYVSYDEMKKHLAERQKHHEERAEFYTAKMMEAEKNLAEQLDEATTVTDRMHTKVSNAYTGVTSERDKHRENARKHAKYAVAFQWRVNHLPAEQGFKLFNGEVVELEFFSDPRYN